ncbi:MAG: iron ABC transporter substrate-binding protein [Rhodospirillales bacterium]|jgi:iron complex transport system substrate-binding protein
MTAIDRRTLLAGGAAATVLPAIPVRAQAPVLDSAGRAVPVPARIERVFPAGPPAAIFLYTLAPELLVGWPRANTAAELEYLLPDVGRRPEVGRLTGRGNTTNLEVLLQFKPDLILDFGTTTETYVSLADRTQAQTGIPYALLDGRLDATAAAYRTLGRLIRREERGEALAAEVDAMLRETLGRVASVPPERRPRVYHARGPRGLETGLGGSINVEAIEIMGARNVAGAQRGGLANVSLEQVLAWDPEVIVTIDRGFATAVRTDPGWASVTAVRNGRVHHAPGLPFGWVDSPPSVNRLIGLRWLGKVLYPDLFPEDLRAMTRAFYARFYHVTPSDAALDRLLSGTA